jgi:peptide chain release factor subunit 1
MSQDQAEQNIQMWKVKKLIKSLDSARGCASPSPSLSYHDVESEYSCSAGTSMISLIIPPKVCLPSPLQIFVSSPLSLQDQISRASAMLTQEYGTASNIKSRVNRLSVLAAITSTQQRLKLYNRVPPNGLVLFVGTILTDEGKEKKVSFDFEPHKPINT